MNRNLISVAAFMLGVILSYYLFLDSSIHPGKLSYKVDTQELKGYSTKLLFLDIFLNNLTVGLLMSVFGFLTGGIVTFALLFWNGYLLGSIYITSINMLPFEDIVYYSKHIPLELFAFMLLSNCGFRGFEFYKKVFKNEIDTGLIPNYRSFQLPLIMLFVASVIETL